MPFSLRQIRLPNTLHIKIKSYCLANDITLTEFYNKAVEWLLHTILLGEMPIYRASFKNGKPISINLKTNNIEKIEKIALANSIAEARVVHTALMDYLDKLKIEIERSI